MSVETLDVNEVVDSIESGEGDEVVLGLVDTTEFETVDSTIKEDEVAIVDVDEEDNENVTVETVVLPVVKAESKADVARKIFAEMYGKEGVARKDIIKRFETEAGLTKAGAATYHQQMVKKAKVAVVEETE